MPAGLRPAAPFQKPIHGPLRGVIGRLLRKDANRAQLVLSVDLIGQAVSVVVEASDVKAY